MRVTPNLRSPRGFVKAIASPVFPPTRPSPAPRARRISTEPGAKRASMIFQALSTIPIIRLSRIWYDYREKRRSLTVSHGFEKIERDLSSPTGHGEGWYYRTQEGGHDLVRGPHSFAEMKALRAKGLIPRTAMVRQGLRGTWQPSETPPCIFLKKDLRLLVGRHCPSGSFSGHPGRCRGPGLRPSLSPRPLSDKAFTGPGRLFPLVRPFGSRQAFSYHSRTENGRIRPHQGRYNRLDQ